MKRDLIHVMKWADRKAPESTERATHLPTPARGDILATGYEAPNNKPAIRTLQKAHASGSALERITKMDAEDIERRATTSINATNALFILSLSTYAWLKKPLGGSA